MTQAAALRRREARTVARYGPALALGAAYGLRLVFVWRRATPEYFPDEYLYAALSRSFAHLSGPDVRGSSAHFLALLGPLLTAPAWLFGSVSTGFRVAQAIGAAAMTLAAVPVYLLARRLRLRASLAYAAAGLTLLVPDMVYAGFLLSEPFAYPLFLGATAAATCALSTPSRRNHLLFLFLSAACVGARAELAVVPLAYVAAVLLLGVGERSLRERIRLQRLPLAAILSISLAAGVYATARGLGYYEALLHVDFRPHAVVDALGYNALTLAYASGWVLVPGAIVGIGAAIRAPRSARERAFATFAATLVAALLIEVSLFGSAAGPTGMALERYSFYCLPLLVLGFCLAAQRGLPYRWVNGAVAAGLLLLAARIPLSGMAQAGATDESPFLWSVERLESWVGDDARAATVVLVAASALALVAAAAPRLGRAGVPLLLALAAVALVAESGGAYVFDQQLAASVARASLPGDPSWVDAATPGPATLLASADGFRGDDLQLFWNRSIQRVDLLPGALPPDQLASANVRVARDGEAFVDGKPLEGPVVIDGTASTVSLQGARRVASAPHATLWLPTTSVRLRLYFTGRSIDGSLAPSGRITLWPEGARISGYLSFDVRSLKGGRYTFRVGDRPVVDGKVKLAICSYGPWSSSYAMRSSGTLRLGELFTGHASEPRFRPDASACRAGR